MTSITRAAFLPILTGWALLVTGCQYMGDSYESLLTLDQSGKYAQAIEGYQKYLQKNPTTSLGAAIHYRIAKDYEAQSDYTSAIAWYEKILGKYPHTDEELHSLLDLASLYRIKLKNPAKTTEYNQRAFNRYMDNIQVRDAIQSLIDSQLSSATSQYSQKNYKGAQDVLTGIGKSFPTVFIQPDTQAKIDSLADRARRAQSLSTASVDWIVLKSEIPFNKSYEQDFSEILKDEQVLASPDNKYLAERKREPNGKYYLYVAKVSEKSDKVTFTRVPQTIGAELPAWSPDGQDLVYWRTVGKSRRLEKTNIQTKITQTLFYTKGTNLGIHPAYHPAGNKIAYVYEGRISLANTGDASYKQLLKTSKKLDYTAVLAWSADGTMIRCTQTNKRGQVSDDLLVLDLSAPSNPQ